MNCVWIVLEDTSDSEGSCEIRSVHSTKELALALIETKKRKREHFIEAWDVDEFPEGEKES